MFPVFNIFGRTIGSYAVCAFIGFFAAMFVATRLAKAFGIEFEDLILFFLTIAAGTLVGGHLVYAITNIDKIIYYVGFIIDNLKTDSLTFEHIKIIISQTFGGMVYYGGFIGATIALLIHLKISKSPLKGRIFDIYAVTLPLFHAFGRIGCFLGGCCYGVECKFGFIANNSLVPEMSGVRRFPVALVESFFNFLIFAFLLYLFKKKSRPNKLIFVYMLIYPIIRFTLEFFRGDEVRGGILFLSTSQWISIIVFIVGIIGYFKKSSLNKNGETTC